MMKILKLILVITLHFQCVGYIIAQENIPDCTSPTIVQLPLSADSVYEEIYYGVEDKYTFWYKIEAAESEIVDYSLVTINESDDYQLLLYQHNTDNFCNNLVAGKTTIITDQSNYSINVNSGETYYLSVVHINGDGCGHFLSIKSNNKVFNYKAIQNKCFEEVLETVVQESILKNEEKLFEEEVVVKMVKDSSYLSGRVINSASGATIEASIRLIDEHGNVSDIFKSSVEEGFKFQIEKDEVVVKINKFGYEPLTDTLIRGQDFTELVLNPVKVGDKIVMRKIYFHPNTYVLKEESKKELEKFKKFILENKQSKYEIQGHTNGNSSIKKNKRYAHLGAEWNFSGSAKKLSKMRAEAIKNYLVKNGANGTQLVTNGYGGDRMIVQKPKTMEQAMKNIRVEVVVIE